MQAFMVIAGVILRPDHRVWAPSYFHTRQSLGPETHIPPLSDPCKPQCLSQWKPCFRKVRETLCTRPRHKLEIIINKWTSLAHTAAEAGSWPGLGWGLGHHPLQMTRIAKINSQLFANFIPHSANDLKYPSLPAVLIIVGLTAAWGRQNARGGLMLQMHQQQRDEAKHIKKFASSSILSTFAQTHTQKF